ncbi:MAG: c-type cytochrome [Phycisphaerae bacterium]|nr:c-type cytochrome [Phycisphaerae bacterium]
MALFTCLVTAGTDGAGAQGPVESAPVHVVGYERFVLDRDVDQQLAGRLLINELNCAACHTGLPGDGEPVIGAKGGPVLVGITERVRTDWLRAFLRRPHRGKAGTTMPAMFHGLADAEATGQIDDILHFLGSVQPARRLAKLPRRSTFARGKLLYHGYGCAACHQPGFGDRDRAGRSPAGGASGKLVAPLPDPAMKYSHRSLTDFLHDPLRTRPSGRMPNMKLDLQDASDIAAYLLGKTDNMDNKSSPPIPRFTIDPVRARRGGEYFKLIGCVNCHAIPGLEPRPKITLKAAQVPKAAAAPQLCAGRPRYAVTRAQRDRVRGAVLAALDTDGRGGGRVSAAQRIDLTFGTFNCYACHRRDGKGGILDDRKQYFGGDPDLADEGRYPPHLTGVGRKLTPAWMGKVLAGTGSVRPYLDTRMPVYGMGNVGHLPDLLVEVDGGMKHDPAVYFAGGDVETGRQLIGTQGGMGCIACHGWKDRRSLGIGAMNLGQTAARMQPEWFKQNLVDPGTLRPGTLMPTFWPQGVSTNKKLLDGDTHRQIASIWKYLAEGKRPPPGYPRFSQGQFELVPTERPIVMRSFTKEAGTHTILVGYPPGVHFMFDTRRGKLVMAWRGRFIDAYSTWFDRFTAPVQALGKDQVRLPATAVLGTRPAPGHARPSYRFLGYRLDKAGVPIFLYDLAGARIEDRIAPTTAGTDQRPGLIRTLKVSNSTGVLLLSPGAAEGLTIRLVRPAPPGDTTFPIKLKRGESKVELEYRW